MPPNSQPPRTIQLASSILEIVTSLETHLAEDGRPPCSFEPGADLPQSQLPPSLQSSVDSAVGALEELNALLLGPMGWMTCQLARSVRYSSGSSFAFHHQNPWIGLTGEAVRSGEPTCAIPLQYSQTIPRRRNYLYSGTGPALSCQRGSPYPASPACRDQALFGPAESRHRCSHSLLRNASDPAGGIRLHCLRLRGSQAGRGFYSRRPDQMVRSAQAVKSDWAQHCHRHHRHILGLAGKRPGTVSSLRVFYEPHAAHARLAAGGRPRGV